MCLMRRDNSLCQAPKKTIRRAFWQPLITERAHLSQG